MASLTRRCGGRPGTTPSGRGRTDSWICRDPDFAAKAARVLDLYAWCSEGQALGDKEFVICADEKTSIQARCRATTMPPGKARLMRVEHEYDRRGAVAYQAARRAPGKGLRALRRDDGYCSLRPLGRAGDDNRTLRERREGVLGSRQRQLS